MPHGDAAGMLLELFFWCFFELELGHVDEEEEEEKGHEEMKNDVRDAPGGVMSVATASALKVKWPDVCQKCICQ